LSVSFGWYRSSRIFKTLGVQFWDTSTTFEGSFPIRRIGKCFHIACLPGPSSSIFPRSETAKSIVGPNSKGQSSFLAIIQTTLPLRNTSVPPMFGRQQRGRSSPGMIVILSARSKQGRHGPSGWSPSWHLFIVSLAARREIASVTESTYLFSFFLARKTCSLFANFRSLLRSS
jgi:hypothetical protein